MTRNNIIIFFALLTLTQLCHAQWTCTLDEQCPVTGSACIDGRCACVAGQQVAAGGTACVDIAPYHASECVEDFQCSNLFNNFECRRVNETYTVGNCFCQPGFHYLHGRCWQTIDYGAACTIDDECMSPTMLDPHSLVCDGTCTCADGYYLRQRGECRKIGYAVGDRCVLTQDCQFPGAVCDHDTFLCANENDLTSRTSQPAANSTKNIAPYTSTNRAHSTTCDMLTPCPDPYVCSVFGVCVCPQGYYQDGGDLCLAELGSPSTEEQCYGLFAVVQGGICTCPANFFFGEDMRNCMKVARTTNDACVFDASCRTFGAGARCGEAGEWGLRSCECDTERAVWDAGRQMCRLFVGIGEQCEADSDCLAGELEVQCAVAADGQGYCACPEGLQEFEGLCLTTGLELGDACQVSAECTETENMVCAGGVCACDSGYQAEGDSCAPIIGGTCAVDSDCVIDHTLCDGDSNTCQCADLFVEYEDECWLSVSDANPACNVSAQCVPSLGEFSVCLSGACVCDTDYHYRDGGCWNRIGLFETCSRTSECFLTPSSDLTECRNSLCQCTFHYEYSEELHTCLSSASSITAGITSIVTVIYLLLR